MSHVQEKYLFSSPRLTFTQLESFKPGFFSRDLSKIIFLLQVVARLAMARTKKHRIILNVVRRVFKAGNTQNYFWSWQNPPSQIFFLLT